MFGNVSSCRCALSVIRNISTSSCNYQATASNTSHYNALGITPKATQADVKAAYYKLSKLYHPDRVIKGADAEENTRKFREVTAAYEVLGNVKLRKLYDKGMHHVGGNNMGSTWTPPNAPAAEDDPKMQFYRSREVRSKPPPPTGSTPIYDFDEWSKQHYGASFQRDQILRKRMQQRESFKSSRENDIKVERILIAMGVVFGVCLILSADARNYDQIRYERNTSLEQPTKVDSS